MSPLPSGRLESLCDLLVFLESVKEPDDDRVWARVADKLAAALECEAATYFVVLAKTGELAARAALGSAGRAVGASPVPAGQGLCGWVARYREPLVVDDAPSDPRFLPDMDRATGFRTRTAMVLPLFDRLDLTGVIELLNKRGGPFDASDLAFAQAACRAAGLALRALRLESTVDRVTAHNASILENLGGGFVAIDAHARMMLCNPAARRILELRDDVAMGQPADESLAAVPGMSRVLLDTLVKKETVKRRELEWTIRGETRVLGYSTLLIQDPRGQVVGAGMTFQDITAFQGKGRA